MKSSKLKINKPIFSVIICVYKISERFYRDLEYYHSLLLKDFELILVIEKNARLKKINFPCKIIRAKKYPISLGEKRDIGYRVSEGEYCAYIDDDAYPHPQWLSNAEKILAKNVSIGAVGGPNLTPNDDSLLERIGGYIYESYFTSGEAQYRFLPKTKRFVSELQGVNLIIRKHILDLLGGFNSKLNSGDDTKVCNTIISLGYKVLYHPKIIVYHHRKSFPKNHLRQIKNMGTHRGFFLKAYPETFSFIYLLPIFLITGLTIGIIFLLFFESLRIYISILYMCMFLIMYFSVVKRAGILVGFVVVFGIILTHYVYGINFIRGLFLSSIEK